MSASRSGQFVDGRRWRDGYAALASSSDLFLSAPEHIAGHWKTALDHLQQLSGNSASALIERVSRQVGDLGMAFRLAGEDQERAWPLNPVPLMIDSEEWAGIERGLEQRAQLLELVVGDIYGQQSALSNGVMPATIATGSPHFWRNMIGLRAPGNHHLHFYAADLARGPDGNWYVLADRVRMPTGVGYALENRLALSRVTSDLLGSLNVRRLAPFLSDLRLGLAADCERSAPRIALLTPGRLNQSYAEQAHLARYLGISLVEGVDLVVAEGRLFVRTIEGLKRIDSLWRWMDSSLLDPLAFDSRSAIGVPDLYEAGANGHLVISNWPGVGVLESRALMAHLPALARHFLGGDLMLPSIATQWYGTPHEGMAEGGDLAAAFGAEQYDQNDPSVMAALSRRPMDFVIQNRAKLSTTPALTGDGLAPLPFILRTFLARDGRGGWKVMPGGFARLAGNGDVRAAVMGESDLSADVCIIDRQMAFPLSVSERQNGQIIRRTSGILPSKAADNLFWLGRYLERAEMTLRLVRSILGGTIEVDSGQTATSLTLRRMIDLLAYWGALPAERGDWNAAQCCLAALNAEHCHGSVRRLMATAGDIGRGLRDRLAVDFWRVLHLPSPVMDGPFAQNMLDASTMMIDRISALSGLAAENMRRTHGWRFHDMGRRLERAIMTSRIIGQFASDDAGADDLSVLLELCDSQISYRTRYLDNPALLPVRDMLVLEPANPRSLAFQVDAIADHLAALPSVRKDAMPEPQQRQATALAAMLAPLTGDALEMAILPDIEGRLLSLSDAIGQRFFLQSEEAEKSGVSSWRV